MKETPPPAKSFSYYTLFLFFQFTMHLSQMFFNKRIQTLYLLKGMSQKLRNNDTRSHCYVICSHDAFLYTNGTSS